ncbi:MAG: ArnT family glycosyltransferase [Bdellovibrionota bacterium]
MVNISRKLNFINIIILLIVSFVVSIYGLSFSYHSFIMPRSSEGELQNISGDGWITNLSRIELSNLSPKLNRLELKFNPWRPDGSSAGLVVKVCGKEVGRFVVESDDIKTLSLDGSCEPRVVSFKVLNPLRASNTDSRQIGAQLISANITSRAKAVFVDYKYVAISTIFVFLITLVSYYALFYNFSFYASFITPILLLILFYNVDNFDLRKMYSLSTFLFWFLSGVALYNTLLKNNKYSYVDEESNNNKNIFYTLSMILVLIGGALIRLYDIDFGLPFNFHPDEVPKVNAIERMHAKFLQGAPHPFDPDYFLHPSLLLYSTYLMSAIFRALNLFAGDFREITCLGGRFVSFFAGMVSIYAVYYIGKKLFTRMTGLMAAIFLALSPLHITCSRYLKEDALLVCFLLLTVAFVIKSVKEDKMKYYFLAAVMAGLACATKYTGLLSIGILFSAPFFANKTFSLKPNGRYLKYFFLVVLLVPITFIAFTPYSVLNFEKFSADFNSERNHATRGHTIVVTANSEYWMYHLRESIVPNFGYIFTALALLGLGFLLKRKRMSDLYLVGLILFFYIPIEYVKSKPAPQPDRYILPCIPFLALAGAEFIRVLGKSKYAITSYILFIVALFFPLNRSVELARDLNPDTRELMATWINENIPKGSTVCIDWKRYGPYLNEEDYNIQYILRAKIIPKLHVPALKRSEYDYLVLSSLFYDRYFSQPADKALRQHFREVFINIPIINEIKASSGTNAFHNPTLTIFSLKKDDIKAHEKNLRLKSEGKIAETNNEKISDFFTKSWRRW